MKPQFIRRLSAATALSAVAILPIGPRPGVPAKAVPGTAQVVAAANAFLKSLDDQQRAKVLYKFDDMAERVRWSNFPTTFVERGGISLKQMTEPQRTAAMAVVAAALSARGYEKVLQIMEADQVLSTQPDNGPGGGRGGRGGGGRGGPPGGGGRGGPPGGGRGGPPGGGGAGDTQFGKELYYIAFMGTPSAKDPWMLQFGGHHLALNITIDGEHGVLTPTLTGAQPALYVKDGKTFRPLGKESDKAYALLNALTIDQRAQAILNYQVGDLVLGPGHDGETIQPEGLRVSTMSEKQRTMLLDLIVEWSGIVNDSYAAERMKEITAGLNETWFAWSGPTTHEEGKGGTAYYRIQGPKLVIEYSPQTLGGDAALHIHAMYRDPTNDYGAGLIKK